MLDYVMSISGWCNFLSIFLVSTQKSTKEFLSLETLHDSSDDFILRKTFLYIMFNVDFLFDDDALAW